MHLLLLILVVSYGEAATITKIVDLILGSNYQSFRLVFTTYVVQLSCLTVQLVEKESVRLPPCALNM